MKLKDKYSFLSDFYGLILPSSFETLWHGMFTKGLEIGTYFQG